MTKFTNPTDYVTYATKFFESIPRTPADVTAVMQKVQAVVASEYKNSQDVLTAYAKVAKGDASYNEITSANKKAAELAKSASFAAFLAMPCALFALPAVVEKAKELNIDFVPASVSAQFSI
jgi:hypothetical protein